MQAEKLDSFIETEPRVDVQESEYKRLLGYPPEHEVGPRVRDLIDSTNQWYEENGRPWVYSRRTEIVELLPSAIRIEEVDLVSPKLHSQLSAAQSDEVLLVAVSAGKACEERARQLWNEEKPDEYFFMEVYGSAVVENLITNLGARFCEWADGRGKAILPHYSPGYPGWDISDQAKLLRLIQQGKGAEFPQQIQVLDSGMLRPKKSMLAVFGVTSHVETVNRLTTLIPCDNCSLDQCQYRRRPYKHSIPQIEDISRFQPGRDNGRGHITEDAAISPAVKYMTNPRALRKWSQERLQFSYLKDLSIEARFRYEGTTCSNMGHSLEFDYHITLSPSADHYRVIAARCVPAPGDEGHTLMCQYLENARQLMSDIEKETPLLGKPLDDVLSWRREYNPSGCYCNSESRDYKWGIAFEVIHYALMEEEKSKSL